MKQRISLLIIIVLVLISVVSLSTYAYFTANVTRNNINDFDVVTGKVNIKIDDSSVSSSDISPIYDEDVEMLAYNKDFEVIADGTLNACARLYLRIDNISEALKSKYFKYKLVSEGIEKTGTFENAQNGKDMLILDNLFLESGSVKYFDLYIWVSYSEEENQLDMLGTSINSSLVVKGIDAKNDTYCNKNKSSE